MAGGWAVLGGLLLLIVSPALPLGFTRLSAGYNAPIWLWTLGGVASIGLAVARYDRWLGAAVVAASLSALPTHTDAAASTVIWLAIGAAALVILSSRLPVSGMPALRWSLVVVASLETAYMVLQAWQIDPLWVGWTPSQTVSPVWSSGTLDNPRYAGAMLAIVVPLAPWWLLPWFGVGLGLSGSYLALLAAVVGLAVRWAGTRWFLVGAMAGLVAASLTLVWTRGNTTFGSAAFRLWTWTAMGQDFAAGGPWVWLMGRGPAGFLMQMWPQQVRAVGEVSAQAHSDILQWVYETGLGGAVVLAGWLRALGRDVRRAAPAWQGAVAALALLTAGLHVFHVPTLAPVGILALAGGRLSAVGR